jgi:Protein of unknown function (DUF4242)
VLETYLVEHYRPGLAVEDLQRAASLLRAAASAMEREGSTLRYVRSTIVPHDEAFMALFEATSEALVREVYRRAGVPFERISTALQADIEGSEQ